MRYFYIAEQPEKIQFFIHQLTYKHVIKKIQQKHKQESQLDQEKVNPNNQKYYKQKTQEYKR